MRTGTAVGVQLERRAKCRTTVSRTDVIDVTRIAAIAVLGINQVNDIVERGRLTPAFMPPVSRAEHAGKVTGRGHTWAGERCPGVGVAPSGAAIGRFVDQIGVVVRETTAAFVHTGDVKRPVSRHVTGNLRVADEGASVGHRYRATPRAAVVSGAAHDKGAGTHVKVVPRNVHVPEEGRTRVIIRPAGLAVVAAARVNAEMGPAIWVRGIGGLKPAQGAARVAIEPDSKPSLGWLVVENNRITKGIGKRTLAAAVGDTRESGATIRGDRYRGDDEWTGVDAS